MLKTTLAVGLANEIQSKMVRKSRWRIKMKKSQHRKVVKANQKAKKRLSPKSGSEQKNQRPPELRILAANQDRS